MKKKSFRELQNFCCKSARKKGKKNRHPENFAQISEAINPEMQGEGIGGVHTWVQGGTFCRWWHDQGAINAYWAYSKNFNWICRNLPLIKWTWAPGYYFVGDWGDMIRKLPWYSYIKIFSQINEICPKLLKINLSDQTYFLLDSVGVLNLGWVEFFILFFFLNLRCAHLWRGIVVREIFSFRQWKETHPTGVFNF